MPEFFVIRLGKDSVEDIRRLDALKTAPDKAIDLTVTCTQVPSKLAKGGYAFIWFGSDNSKGAPTDWKMGLRAVAVVTSLKGGPGYNDSHDIGLRISVVLPSSIDKKDLLAKASAAYYWMSDVPVIGLSSSSNQTAQQIKTEEQQQDIRALLYALEAVHPGFRAQLSEAHPELAGLFNYTPPSPGSSAPSLTTPGVTPLPADGEEASLGAPEELPADWILALASKGFILISGPSGTGKSRTARDIARALDYPLEPEFAATATACRPANCLAFVPVGADWTDGTPLIGFRNFFGPSHVEKDGGGERVSYENWEPPAALRLLLRAQRLPDQPYFLVLDEMNLSHVERYFSQFLSLLESNRGLSSSSKLGLLDADSVKLVGSTLAAAAEHPLEKSVADELTAAKQGLTLPDNLFIVGTVNVDETTYMFSPKVLDRAHVLEMQTPDPTAYMKGEASEVGALIPADKARLILVRAAQRRRNGFWEKENPVAILKEAANGTPFASELPSIVDVLQKLLAGLRNLLEPVGFGFAYRTINEVCAYVATYIEYGDPALFSNGGKSVGWHEALDRAIFQKVLPKIHGNRRQLGESLRALNAFLMNEPAAYALGSRKVEVAKDAATGVAFPISAAKVKAMSLRLEATGHTTFVI
jgi:hypothetical protein